jgi:hypothetical protein
VSNILFIGDYFPLMSQQTLRNHLIAQDLFQKGHKLFLVSKAWCKVKAKNFLGSIDELSVNAPFEHRFYIDPIQIRTIGNNILLGYLGLCLDIFAKYHIDYVYFAEDMEYAILIENLKKRVQFKCIMGLRDINNFSQGIYDIYMRHFIELTLKHMDVICSYKSVVNNLNLAMFECKPSLPFSTYKHKESQENMVYIFGIINKTVNSDYLRYMIENSFGYMNKKIIILGNYAEQIKNKLSNLTNIEFVNIASINDLHVSMPDGSIVINVMDLIEETSDIDRIYTQYCYNHRPIVKTKSLQKLQEDLDFSTEQFCNDFSIINEISMKYYVKLYSLFSD